VRRRARSILKENFMSRTQFFIGASPRTLKPAVPTTLTQRNRAITGPLGQAGMAKQIRPGVS
jgi:hypothetical protein